MEAFVLVTLALLVWLFFFIRHKIYFSFYKSKKYKEMEKRSEAIERSTLKQITDFGSTPEEREKGINRMFDEKKQTVYFIEPGRCDSDINGRKNRNYIFSIGKTSRNLAAFSSKEREFLRLTFLLYNYSQIPYDDFKKFAKVLIGGDGKALHESEPSGPTKYHYYFESKGPVRKPEHSEIDSTISKILNIIECIPASSPIKTRLTNRISGGGVWFEESDIEHSAFADSGNYKLRIGQLLESERFLYYSGEGSLITIAPPGSGKTQCFVLPNMLSWPGSAFVFDIKGEIYAATHEWRSKNVGKVIKFSPLDPGSSHHYNPLVFIRSERDYIWEDSRFLADMIIVPSGSSDPFWDNTARDFLTSAIAYVCYNNEPGNRPMSKVLDLMYGIDLVEMIVDLKNTTDVAAMRQVGNSLYEIEKKTIDSVLKTAQSHLSAWQGERINRVTQKSDWSPLDLRNGKVTVYLCINPSEIDSYLSLLRVMIAQHIRMLTTKLPERDSAPILFMVDELPRLKRMLPIEEGLEIGRQYRIILWLFAQSIGQLKQPYPNVDGFVGACAVRTFMNIPLNDDLAKKISDQLGYRESPFDNSRHKMVEPLYPTDRAQVQMNGEVIYVCR